MHLQTNHLLLLASKILSWKPDSCLSVFLVAQMMELGVIKCLYDIGLYDKDL